MQVDGTVRQVTANTQQELRDILLFLADVPVLAALLLKPNLASPVRRKSTGLADFSLLILWWLYLYLFFVVPWQYIAFDEARYGTAFNRLGILMNVVLLSSLTNVPFEAVLAQADRGVYEAKRLGKNRAVGMVPPVGPAKGLRIKADRDHNYEVQTLCVQGPPSSSNG